MSKTVIDTQRLYITSEMVFLTKIEKDFIAALQQAQQVFEKNKDAESENLFMSQNSQKYIGKVLDSDTLAELLAGNIHTWKSVDAGEKYLYKQAATFRSIDSVIQYLNQVKGDLQGACKHLIYTETPKCSTGYAEPTQHWSEYDCFICGKHWSIEK